MAASKKQVTVQEFAAKHGVGERKVRRVLRSMDQGIGRGKRYGLTTKTQNALTKALGL